LKATTWRQLTALEGNKKSSKGQLKVKAVAAATVGKQKREKKCSSIGSKWQLKSFNKASQDIARSN
jgi:hypothetical protein